MWCRDTKRCGPCCVCMIRSQIAACWGGGYKPLRLMLEWDGRGEGGSPMGKVM